MTYKKLNYNYLELETNQTKKIVLPKYMYLFCCHFLKYDKTFYIYIFIFIFNISRPLFLIVF